MKTFRILNRIAALLALLIGLASVPSSAQERQATMMLNNATQATLLIEFVRDANRSEFVVVTLQPGENRNVQVPSGVVTMTVTAPYASADLRYVATEALSTAQSYDVVLTAQGLNVANLRDDLRPGGAGQGGGGEAGSIYAACNGISASAEIWFIYNPNNNLSRATYLRSGSYLCGDDGSSAYRSGAPLQNYSCTASYRDCERNPGWDARPGSEVVYSNETYEGVSRPTERRNFVWEFGDYADWQLIIYR
jgi:hypothetical protein